MIAEKRAKLVDAAPDLLLELKLLVSALESCAASEDPYIECRLAFAREAIAKAE